MSLSVCIVIVIALHVCTPIHIFQNDIYINCGNQSRVIDVSTHSTLWSFYGAP